MNKEIDLSKHWNNAYSNKPEEKLGWYETDLSPTLKLITKTGLNKSARILNIGAGSTTLIDELIKIGYLNLIATDLSEVALKNLKDRIGNRKVECIVDDLTKPTKLKNIASVDLWIDRAVLHFFTEKTDQDTYFKLLNSKVNKDGFALIAEFNLKGATVCSGLPIHRYSKEMLIEKLENNFELIDSFDYTYIMPNGAERPYIYTLFRKK
ncbi:MAG: class I SAM-dependent methyltransferase [Bacteroidetes bacterium]|nr:MAG: class I SAM-dependent methyltransferase [Bacteroidota bacterium]